MIENRTSLEHEPMLRSQQVAEQIERLEPLAVGGTLE
jgi:hypothetical protein